MTGLLPCSAASAAPISCHDRASSKCNNNAPVRSRACFCSPTRTYSFSDTAPLWRDDLPSERRRASDFELALARAQGAATNGSTDDWETVATISETRERKVEELGGRIVADLTDQESGRRDDRAAWSELVREARDPERRRFDAVVIYSTSRLARDLFRALAYERELARARVEVLYAVAAGDQSSPEGRLVRHIFQALDQFEVEKLGRETRRGQTENTRQGYRSGGRAPYGYCLERQPHPAPRCARAGDHKSRLAPDSEQAPVVVEIFDRYLAGWGFKEIANHLNRPGGPAPPRHVDSQRNTAGKWSKTTIRAILENPALHGQAALEPA